MMGNQTSVREFILLGLTSDAKLQAVIFLFLLLTYILSITGNLTIIFLTLLDYRLQTPMYFFLRNFSVLEISFTSVFVPQMLVTIGTGNRTISFAGCFAQYFFAILLGATEFYLLAAMSYDRYIAICKPLHYTAIMSRRLCFQLVLCSWFSGFLVVIVLCNRTPVPTLSKHNSLHLPTSNSPPIPLPPLSLLATTSLLSTSVNQPSRCN